MTAMTETYVDPSIAGNSGTGTSGDPYGDLQYALDTMTRDATNGDRLNIKAGTAEFMTTANGLSLATYGTPTSAAPLTFQGYTSTAGDGGIGVLDGAGLYSVMVASTLDFIHFVDLTLQDCGTVAHMVHLDRYILFENITAKDHNGTHALRVGNVGNFMIGCTVTDVAGTGLLGGHCMIYRSKFIEGATYQFSSYAALLQVTGSAIVECIADVSGASGGFQMTDGLMVNNSVYSAAGTGKGLRVFSERVVIANNLVEGFSTGAGKGINYDGTYTVYSDGNAVEACVTEYAGATDRIMAGDSDNESLSGSPFTNAGSGDFSRVDIDNVKEGSLPAKIGIQ